MIGLRSALRIDVRYPSQIGWWQMMSMVTLVMVTRHVVMMLFVSTLYELMLGFF